MVADSWRDSVDTENPIVTVEADFLATIHAVPDDATTIQVFADWLEDRGDPRGKFVHAALEWRKHGRFDPLPALRRFGEEFRGPAGESFRRLAECGEVQLDERGLLRLLLTSFPTPDEDLPVEVWGWLGTLEIRPHPREFRSPELRMLADLIGRLPMLRRLSLHLLESPGPDWFEAIGRVLPRPIEIRLELEGLSGSGHPHPIDALAGCPTLHELALRRCGLSNDDAFTLSRWPEGRELRRLELNGNTIGDDGAAALATSPILERLEALSLAHNPLTDVGLLALLNRTGLPALRELHFGSAGISLAGYGAWLRSPLAPPPACDLHVGNFHFSYTRRTLPESGRRVELTLNSKLAGWARAFVEFPMPPKTTSLRLLNLHRCVPDELRAVLDLPAFAGLRTLVVTGDGLDGASVRALLDTSVMQSVGALSVSGPCGSEGVLAVLAAPVFSTAHLLHLPGVRLEARDGCVRLTLSAPALEIVTAFGRSPGVARVTHVIATEPGLDAVVALARLLPSGVKSLTLVRVPLDSARLAGLLAALPAGQLRELALSDCALTEGGISPLVEATTLEGLETLRLSLNRLAINGPAMARLRQRFTRVELGISQ